MTTLPAENPMPKFFRHPIRVTMGKIKLAGWTAIAGHTGIFAVVALYYLLFQTNADVKHVWDTLLTKQIHVTSDATWTFWRHLIRNVGEYFLGTLLVVAINLNPYAISKKALKKLSPLDKLELKLHIPSFHQNRTVSVWQLLASPAVAITYAIPGFIVGALIMLGIRDLGHLHTIAPALGSHPSFVQKLYEGEFDQHIVGIIAGIFMGRRPMKKVFADIQRFFAERRVARGKQARFYHPLPFKVLVDDIAQHGQKAAIANQAARGTWVPALMVGGTFVLVALAAFGYHVLHDIAH